MPIVENRLRLGKTNKKNVFLVFPLGLHYLCRQIAEKDNTFIDTTDVDELW